MVTWHVRYERSNGRIIDLQNQLAETPQKVVQQIYSSTDWYLDRITTDSNQPCWHFKLRDTDITVYVWKNENLYPNKPRASTWAYCEQPEITGPRNNPEIHVCGACNGCRAYKADEDLDYWKKELISILFNPMNSTHHETGECEMITGEIGELAYYHELDKWIPCKVLDIYMNEFNIMLKIEITASHPGYPKGTIIRTPGKSCSPREAGYGRFVRPYEWKLNTHTHLPNLKRTTISHSITAFRFRK